jgi:hypothetical protein
MYMALPRTSKPCTPILILSNSILQYKGKLQRDNKAPKRKKFSTREPVASIATFRIRIRIA